MTWTPNDGPSRETLLNDPFYASTDDMNDLRLIALAAHDLYEENQRLKAELQQMKDRAADAPLQYMAAKCDRLKEENQRLQVSLELAPSLRDDLQRQIRQLGNLVARKESELAEAKRDTERLDWLEAHRLKELYRVAWYDDVAGTLGERDSVRRRIDNLMGYVRPTPLGDTPPTRATDA